MAVGGVDLTAFLGTKGQHDDANIHTYGEFLLPFLEQDAIYKQIDFTQPYFAPADLTAIGLPNYKSNNQAAVARVISTFLCPSAPCTANPYSGTWNDLGDSRRLSRRRERLRSQQWNFAHLPADSWTSCLPNLG